MWGPAWIEIRWNSNWLRARSHMTSHCTGGIRDPMTWCWRCLETAFGHFLLGSQNFMVTALGSCVLCVGISLCLKTSNKRGHAGSSELAKWQPHSWNHKKQRVQFEKKIFILWVWGMEDVHHDVFLQNLLHFLILHIVHKYLWISSKLKTFSVLQHRVPLAHVHRNTYYEHFNAKRIGIAKAASPSTDKFGSLLSRNPIIPDMPGVGGNRGLRLKYCTTNLDVFIQNLFRI